MTSAPIFKMILPQTALTYALPRLRDAWHRYAIRGQTGMGMEHAMFMYQLLEPLLGVAAVYLGDECEFVKEAASFRMQPASGEGALGLHQDGAIPLFRGSEDPDSFVTMWVPLCGIAMEKPTLAVATDIEPNILPHVSDKNGYLLLKDEYSGPVRPIWWVAMGDVVVIHSRLVHGTFVPPGCAEPRASLDIRVRKKRRRLPPWSRRP